MLSWDDLRILPRFLSKIQHDEKGCWIWADHLASNGYGSFRVGLKTIGAHRVAWVLYKGVIPDGLFVLHKCDVKSCVNPDHLFLGTQADNIKDMINKNRHPHGLSHGNTKLTTDQVKYIRASSLSLLTLARKLGVSKKTILQVKHRKIFKHIPEEN